MTGLSSVSASTAVQTPTIVVTAQHGSDVQNAIDQIKALTSDDGFLGLGRNGNVKEAVELLESLSPEERNAVIAGLSDADLAALAEDISSTGIFGASGLSTDEKRDLFNQLAQSLDGEQLSRLTQAFDSTYDIALLGDAIATHADSAAKVEYVEAQADHVVVADGASPSNQVQTHAAAGAVAKVMGSLTGADMDAAIKTLSSDELAAVVDAAIASEIDVSGSMTSTTYDPSALRAILDGAATAGVDPKQKAALFTAAGDALKDMGSTPLTLYPNLDAATKTIADGLTGILNSDTNGVIGQLETHDRDGGALTAYSAAVLKQENGGEILGEHLARIRNGEGLNEVAFDRFAATDANGNLKNAQNLGYLSGALQAGVDDAVAAGKDEAKLVGDIFGKLIGLATSRLPPGASQAAELVTQATIDAMVDLATASDQSAQFATAAYPTDAAGTPYEGESAETAYDTAVGRVLDAQR